ncbi:MAG: ABC transporter substrate-binding protein [Acetobacteraceae bacterium]
MSLSRRTILRGSAATLAMPAIARHGFAEEPIRIGWLGTFTGPLSSPTIGFDRGAQWVLAQINGAGGVNGRMIELVIRDTQGDPTKAVNATQEVISRQKVHAIYGPLNSGELLATTPIMSRAKIPSLVVGVVNSLIDPVKYPNAFRIAPANAQWDDAVRNYCIKNLKAKKVAVLADATGYGTAAHDDAVAGFKKAGIEVVYDGVIDPAQPDVTPDLLRAKNAGADVLVSWTVSSGMAARMMNARGALNWDVPIAGHPILGTGDIGRLINKPEYWDKVYQVGYRSCSYGPDGKLPPASQQFVESVKGKIQLSDTSLWWVLSGVDGIRLVAEAVQKTGSTDSEKIIAHWNTLQMWPGLFGHYSFSPTDHNGFLGSDVVMSKANSVRDGAFDLAPGYA